MGNPRLHQMVPVGLSLTLKTRWSDFNCTRLFGDTNSLYLYYSRGTAGKVPEAHVSVLNLIHFRGPSDDEYERVPKCPTGLVGYPLISPALVYKRM